MHKRADSHPLGSSYFFINAYFYILLAKIRFFILELFFEFLVTVVLKLLNVKLSKRSSDILIVGLFEIIENIRENSKKFKKIQDFVTFCSIWQFDVLNKSKVLSQSKAFLNWIGFVQSRKINFTPLFSSNKKIGFLRFCCTAFRIS